MDLLPLESVADHVGARPGLMIGPGYTCGERSYEEFLDAVAEEFGVRRRGDSLLRLGDRLLDDGVSPQTLRESVRARAAELPGHAVLKALATVPWSAVMSFSAEGHFYERAREAADETPLARQPTRIVVPGQTAPLKSLLILERLGSYARTDFPCGQIEYRSQAPQWRQAYRAFGDKNRGAAILCLGLGHVEEEFLETISELAFEPTYRPSLLIFVRDDPFARSPRLERAEMGGVARVVLDATPGEFVRAVVAGSPPARTAALSAGSPQGKLERALLPFADVVTYANSRMAPDASAKERLRLLDALFSPDVADWDPFAHSYDLPRTVGAQLLQAVMREISAKKRQTRITSHILHGAAATGKTVILKRLAFDLASAGDDVLWIRRTMNPEVKRALRGVFRAVASARPAKSRPVVVVLDDPLSSRAVQAADVVAAADDVSIDCHLVVAVRQSDWQRASADRFELVGGAPISGELEVSDALDPAEWEALPKYLVRIGADAATDDAELRVSTLRSRPNHDTLTTLYWLLPETRASISASVRDEYVRLGDGSEIERAIIDTVKAHDVMRRAYEMVAACDRIRVPLPIEVLVSALQIDYREWMDLDSQRESAWGLLYKEEEDVGETVLYRTRNPTVSRVVAEMMNGGHLRRSGEAQVLGALISVCSGSTPVYRGFCRDVLVRNPRLQDFEFEELLPLYESAIRALPSGDRVIQHHLGILQRDVGRDPKAALDAFESALETPALEVDGRMETESNIHTSAAATYVDMIGSARISREEGRERALFHLDKARADGVLDAHAVHVQAELLVKMAAGMGSDERSDHMTLVAQAVGDIDRALFMIRSADRADPARLRDLRMLEDVRGNVYASTVSGAELESEAEALWSNFGRQDGLVLVARRAAGNAIASGKGRDFARAYAKCRELMDLVRNAGATPEWGLFDAALQTYYMWMVRRHRYQDASQDIDWNIVLSCSQELTASKKAQPDWFYRYLSGLAYAHAGDWKRANAVFSHLRQSGLPRNVLWSTRDYLLGRRGRIRTVQGEIKRSAGRTFVYSSDLQADFQADSKDRWPSVGAIVHVCIAFAVGGMTAIRADVKPEV